MAEMELRVIGVGPDGGAVIDQHVTGSRSGMVNLRSGTVYTSQRKNPNLKAPSVGYKFMPGVDPSLNTLNGSKEYFAPNLLRITTEPEHDLVGVKVEPPSALILKGESGGRNAWLVSGHATVTITSSGSKVEKLIFKS